MADLESQVSKDKERASSRRYSALWKMVAADEDSPLVAEVTEPHVIGSLRPEVTQLRVEIDGQTISITNGEAVFAGQELSVQARLTALELLAGNEATTRQVALDLVAEAQIPVPARAA